MLQRIQSVWIGLATVAAVFLYVTSLDVKINALPYVSIMSAVLGILGVLSFFSYKNRKRQLMLNNISIFINALLIGVLVYWLLKLSGGISFPEKGIEPVFPALAIVCLIIANIYIRKDEKLVKSVDRLR